MMLGATTTSVEIYPATVKSIDGQFTMEVELSKAHKPELMKMDNSSSRLNFDLGKRNEIHHYS